MEQVKIQRIVGILVVMSFVIISLPFLMNKNNLLPQKFLSNSLPIASENASTIAPVVSNTSSEITHLPVTPMTPPLATLHQTNTPSIDHTHIKTTMLPQGWVVQIGIFRDTKNVERLVKQLHVSGYNSKTFEMTLPSGKKGISVIIGPVENRMIAQKLSQTIKKQLNLHGIVMRYPIH